MVSAAGMARSKAIDCPASYDEDFLTFERWNLSEKDMLEDIRMFRWIELQMLGVLKMGGVLMGKMIQAAVQNYRLTEKRKKNDDNLRKKATHRH